VGTGSARGRAGRAAAERTPAAAATTTTAHDDSFTRADPTLTDVGGATAATTTAGAPALDTTIAAVSTAVVPARPTGSDGTVAAGATDVDLDGLARDDG
jgi:hypothetical protein